MAKAKVNKTNEICFPASPSLHAVADRHAVIDGKRRDVVLHRVAKSLAGKTANKVSLVLNDETEEYDIQISGIAHAR